ncbi:MAG TPA: PIN domain-containing protein [Polyangia bacterium]|nr:PIN domain-containing protein [Polyangia bacterium]
MPTSAAAARLLDTGPLVALLSKNDAAHEPCVRAFETFRGRLLTTEAVLTEATHLLGRAPRGRTACLDFFLQAGALLVPIDVARLRRCRELMERYHDVPMDFADATLVALAEELGVGQVFTLDRRGFSAYRWRRTRRFTLSP